METKKYKYVRKHSGTMIIMGLPTTTKQLFKAACARHGKSMREVLIGMMRSFIKSTDGTTEWRVRQAEKAAALKKNDYPVNFSGSQD